MTVTGQFLVSADTRPHPSRRGFNAPQGTEPTLRDGLAGPLGGAFAETRPFVVGVDTHAATHSYSIIEAHTARKVDASTFPTHTQGLERAVAWIGRRTDGNVSDTLISVEGTGSYGIRLTRALQQIGYRVVDAPSPKRNRGESKNDTIDAHKAAMVMINLKVEDLADARTGDLHECLKTVLAARNPDDGGEDQRVQRADRAAA